MVRVSGQFVISALRLTRGAAVVVVASLLPESVGELLSNGRTLPRLDMMPTSSVNLP